MSTMWRRITRPDEPSQEPHEIITWYSRLVKALAVNDFTWATLLLALLPPDMDPASNVGRLFEIEGDDRPI